MITDLISHIRRFGLEFTQRYYGTYLAVVIDISEIADEGKLHLKVTDITGPTNKTILAYQKGLVSKDMGIHWVPAVGDIVWVEFRKGNPLYPYWEGSFYAKKERPKTKLTPDDIGFIFPDGTIAYNNSKDGIFKVLHSSGKEISISKDGFMYNEDNLLKGPDTHKALEEIQTSLQEIVLSLPTGIATPKLIESIAKYTIDIQDLLTD